MSYKYKLTIEYEGTRFSGWQVQKNARSIQGELIHAASKSFSGKMELQGAGRTDAGVHALEQVAHLEMEKNLAVQNILYGLNDHLPHDINVLSVEKAPPRFHARHHAKARSYLYLISRKRTAFGKRFVWWIKDELDFEAMKRAATIFVGFHDYASFADKRMEKDASTEVELQACELLEAESMIYVRVVGSHFLWKMVRRMVGVLAEVGRKQLTAHDLAGFLHAYSDGPSKFTAPPSGLFLEKILYEGDRLSPLKPLSFPLLRSS